MRLTRKIRNQMIKISKTMSTVTQANLMEQFTGTFIFVVLFLFWYYNEVARYIRSCEPYGPVTRFQVAKMKYGANNSTISLYNNF